MPENDLGPLQLQPTGGDYRVTVVAADSLLLDVPPNYNEVLERRCAEIFAANPQARLVFDLQDVPAISSRHLGLMLELQKAARKRHPRLPLAGVSHAVRELLETTQTVRFFEIP